MCKTFLEENPTKGLEGERCNVTACDTGIPATEQHLYRDNDQRTGPAYYCVICASRIANACRNDGFKLFSFMPDEEWLS